MRILVFFDLPVKSKVQRRAATRFRICNGMDSVTAHKNRLYQAVPARGSVRVLVITEKQYAGLEILLGGPAASDDSKQQEDLMVF